MNSFHPLSKIAGFTTHDFMSTVHIKSGSNLATSQTQTHIHQRVYSLYCSKTVLKNGL